MLKRLFVRLEHFSSPPPPWFYRASNPRNTGLHPLTYTLFHFPYSPRTSKSWTKGRLVGKKGMTRLRPPLSQKMTRVGVSHSFLLFVPRSAGRRHTRETPGGRHPYPFRCIACCFINICAHNATTRAGDVARGFVVVERRASGWYSGPRSKSLDDELMTLRGLFPPDRDPSVAAEGIVRGGEWMSSMVIIGQIGGGIVERMY